MCGKEVTIKIEAIPMPCGDFFIMEYEGRSGAKHVLVLDMGTQAAYREKGREALRRYEAIDLCVLSHIHDDHIGGALKYVDDVRGGLYVPEIKQWWFNAQRVFTPIQESKASEPISVIQANRIAMYLSNHYDGKGWRNEIKRGEMFDFDGLKIYVLSPAEAKLYAAAPYHEDEQNVIPIAVSQNDYTIKVNEFDMNSFVEDQSDYNIHSIALLLEYEGRRFLWMADAVPSVLIQSLRELGYSEENPVQCEYMTLSHHGSKGNTSLELLSLIRCNKYIITGNGMNTYNLPNKETLARFFHQFRGDVQLYATSLSWQLKKVFEEDGKYKIEEKSTFEM